MGTEAGIRIVSVHNADTDWVASGDTQFSALYFGERKTPTSPVALFVRAGKEVGDRIAGLRTHETPVMIVIMAGSAEIDGRWLVPGQIEVIPEGVPHGDMVVGPDGVTLLLLFARRSGLIPTFVDPADQSAFEEDLRSGVELAAQGLSEESVALLPPRETHTPRRGIKVLDFESGEVGVAPPHEGLPGVIYTHLTDDSLPWGPRLLNARTALIVLGDVSDPSAPTVGVIDVQPGPGDRLRGRHLHHCDAVNLVLRGALYMDGVWLRPGGAKIVDSELVYGDALVGPEGVNFIEIWSRQDGAEPLFNDPDDQKYFDNIKAKGHLTERVSL